MKLCFKCGEGKPLSEFYKHPAMADGHLGKCKSCTKSDMKRTRDSALDEWRRRDRKRYYEQEHRREACKAAGKRASAGRSRAEYAARNPLKKAAHTAVGNAVRDGRLEKGPCERCGSAKRVHGHHEDYNKPLVVRWLCSACHGLEHRIGI